MADTAAAARVIWDGTPKQGEFLDSTADEILFGGAAGGGKTDGGALWLTGITDNLVQHPRYRAVVFREKYKDLAQIWQRAQALYPTLWPGTKCVGSYPMVAKFPSGAEVLFSAITKDFENDWQGQEVQRVLWDELCQQATDKRYRYMLSRVRCSWKPDLRCLSAATANPIGPGRAWVRKRWHVDAEGNPTHFVARWKDDEDVVHTARRQFIPSRLSDNPHLGGKKGAYYRNLSALPKTQREALLRGRWDVKIGTFFEEFDAKRHVIKSRELPAHWPRWRCLDWGYAAPFAVYYLAMDGEGNIHLYHEIYGTRQTVDVVAARMKEYEATEKRRIPTLRYELSPADPAIWSSNGMERPEASIGQAFADAGVHWGKAKDTDNSRESGAMEMRRRLRRTVLGLGNGLLVHDCCVNWIRTVPELLFDEDNIEDVDTDMEDHAYDSSRYGIMRRRLPPQDVAESDAWLNRNRHVPVNQKLVYGG